MDREMGSLHPQLDLTAPARAERVLKESDWETTEVVYLLERDGESGPFVRKTIRLAEGVGSAWMRLHQVQRSGAQTPHLPRVLSCEQVQDRLAVLMDFIPGETLAATVASNGGSLGLARIVFPQVCDAIAALHKLPGGALIHRDVKPQNVLFDRRTCEVTVIDLGIARAWHEGAATDTMHFGTRGFAPPEQFGFGQTDERSDVYALGMLLAYLSCGADPGSLQRDDLLAATPIEVRSIVKRATAFDPDERFRNVEELRRAFRIATREMRVAPVEAAPSPDPSPTKRRRILPGWLARVWNALLIACVALIVVGSVGAVVYPTPENEALPLWFLAGEYLLFLAPVCATTAWVLYDKRRLEARFPKLQDVPWLHHLFGAGVFNTADALLFIVTYNLVVAPTIQ